MKIRFLKLKDWLLMTVMGVLGLTACHNTKEVAKQPAEPEKEPVAVNPRGDAALMYGVPTMDFVLKGRVIDAQGNPVSGMQVILLSDNVDITPEEMHEDNPFVQEYIAKSSDTTDAEGNFQCQMQAFPKELQRVIVRDADGEKNGEYGAQMMEVKFTENEQTETRKGWYAGKREKDVDITVMKKR